MKQNKSISEDDTVSVQFLLMSMKETCLQKRTSGDMLLFAKKTIPIKNLISLKFLCEILMDSRHRHR